MKTLTKLLTMTALTMFLALGSSQLTVTAAGSCPADSCADVICLMYAIPVGTCYINGQEQEIFRLDFCPVDYCYAPADPC